MTEERSETAIRRDRFSGGPARSFLSSMADDDRIFEADLMVDRAHVIMLEETGIISTDTASAILEALAAIEAAGYAELPAAEDVHEAIETAVIDRVGTEGGRMHTARSRNDEVATCLRLQLREELLDLAAAVIGLRASLIESAEEHVDTVMPGYTHLQPAQPTTVAHYALSYAATLERETARVIECYNRVNQSPLGAAAFAGTPYDIDRDRTAELLGFDGLVINAMDASSTRDFLVEAMAVTSSLGITLSGLAEDLILFSHRGFIELDDDFASTSSIMPQKKNPDTLELSRAAAGEAMGTLQGLLGTLKGLPRAYNRDLQRAHPDVFSTVERVCAATDVMAGALSTAIWNEQDLAAAAAEGFTTATGVADVLTENGMPFRTAHEIVATAVRAVEEPRTDALLRELADATADLTDGDSLESYVSSDAIAAILEPRQNVESRDSVGGPAPAAVRTHLEAIQTQLQTDRECLADRRAALATASSELAREVGTR